MGSDGIKIETIEKAAILRDGVVFSSTSPEARHHHIMKEMSESLGLRYLGAMEQGFVTNTGRFVGRVEAAKIAFAAKQIPYEKRMLYTEDLFTNGPSGPSGMSA